MSGQWQKSQQSKSKQHCTKLLSSCCSTQEFQQQAILQLCILAGNAHLLVLECDVKGAPGDDLTNPVLALVGATALVVHLHLCNQNGALQSYN